MEISDILNKDTLLNNDTQLCEHPEDLDIHEKKGMLLDNAGHTNINGWTRAKQIRDQHFEAKERGDIIIDAKNGNFNAKKEALKLYEKYINMIFETNLILNETDLENRLNETHIEPQMKKLTQLSDKRYKHLRRYNKRDFKLIEVLTENFNTLYPQALNNNIENNNIVFQYSVCEDNRHLCKTEYAYSFFERSEDHFIIAQLALHNTALNTDQIFEDICREDNVTIDLNTYHNIISNLKNQKVITTRNKSGKNMAELTDKGQSIYEFGKILPHKVGIDLSTSILQELYLEGSKFIEDLIVAYTDIESHEDLMNSISTLEDMKLISSKKTIRITPLGREKYENVIEKAIYDTKEEYIKTSDMLKDKAIRLNIFQD